MKKNVIHIYGASGSGTSTLGKAIAAEFGYHHMDTDDYFWLLTEPKYTTTREVPERIELMKRDIKEHERVVISGSLTDWGDVLIPYFDLAVRIVIDAGIRMERLKKREIGRYGDRIEKDGELYQRHIEFIEWAAAYDSGDINIRSKAKHDEWQRLLKCEQIVIDGSLPIAQNIELIRERLI